MKLGREEVWSGVVAWAVFASFLLYYGLACFRVDWGADLQMYCAGVARLYRDLLHPTHEAMNAPGSEGSVYTPYLVVVAWFGRLFGATPYRALQVAGVVNLVLYVVAVRYFVSRYSMHRRADLAAAVFLLVTLFLRWKHFGWSSETNVVSMQYVQAYPSMLGWALALAAFGLVEDLHRSRRAWLVTALAFVLCALLLTHLITATWVIGIVGLRALWFLARERDWRFAAGLAAATAAALALAILLPFSPFLQHASITGSPEPSHFGRRPFSDFANLYIVALPCAAWLLVRCRRHAFVLLGFLATFAALMLWTRVVGVPYAYRYSFFMAFWAHFLVAEVAMAGLLAIRRSGLESGIELPAERRHAWLDRPLALAVLLAALLAWLPSPMWQKARKGQGGGLASPRALVRGSSSHDRYYRRFAWLVGQVGPGDVVLMPLSRSAFDLASITGAQVVISPNAMFVRDRKERERDVERFFSEHAAPGLRRAVAERYRATKVLLIGKRPAAVDGGLERLFGPPLHRDGSQVLFDARAR